MKVFATAAVLGLFTLPALGVQVSLCPQVVQTRVSVEKVFKSSIYSEVTGWKTAQKTLQATQDLTMKFHLRSKDQDACHYVDGRGQMATLLTSKFHDPEEYEPIESDRLVLNLKLQQSNFRVYYPIKSYSHQGLVGFESESQVKIKARLLSKGKVRDFDIGTVGVVIR